MNNPKIYFAEIGSDEIKELPIVEGSLKIESEDVRVPEPISRKSYSFNCKIVKSEFDKMLSYPPKVLRKAQEMLDSIKNDVQILNVCKPPLNRKERRSRVKALNKKIAIFNTYCKEHGLHLIRKKNDHE